MEPTDAPTLNPSLCGTGALEAVGDAVDELVDGAPLGVGDGDDDDLVVASSSLRHRIGIPVAYNIRSDEANSDVELTR